MLDDLANASSEAAQAVSATCPKDAAATAPARLKAMQQRLEAMKAAIARVRNPFETFWETLDDDQKAQLAEAGKQRVPFLPKFLSRKAAHRPTRCPGRRRRSRKRLQLNDEQRVGLAVLQHMSVLADNTVNFACQPDENLDPAGPASDRRDPDRCHAGRDQAGCARAGRFPRLAQRRAESPVREYRRQAHQLIAFCHNYVACIRVRSK